MLFRSKLFDHWDTWMYYHEGRYYLYYLINNGIGRTNWDGFGVAVSEDGVHYEDQGRVLIQSEKIHVSLVLEQFGNLPILKKVISLFVIIQNTGKQKRANSRLYFRYFNRPRSLEQARRRQCIFRR